MVGKIHIDVNVHCAIHMCKFTLIVSVAKADLHAECMRSHEKAEMYSKMFVVRLSVCKSIHGIV